MPQLTGVEKNISELTAKRHFMSRCVLPWLLDISFTMVKH